MISQRPWPSTPHLIQECHRQAAPRRRQARVTARPSRAPARQAPERKQLKQRTHQCAPSRKAAVQYQESASQGSERHGGLRRHSASQPGRGERPSQVAQKRKPPPCQTQADKDEGSRYVHATQDAHCAREHNQITCPQANPSMAEDITVACRPVCQVAQRSDRVRTRKGERACKPPPPLSLTFGSASPTTAEACAAATREAKHAPTSIAHVSLVNNRRRMCCDNDNRRQTPTNATSEA